MMNQQKINVKLPKLHAGQHEVRTNPARFKVLNCGRRWGKSRLAVTLATATALQGGKVWWLSPSYQVGQIGFRDLQRLAGHLPDGFANVNRSTKMVELKTGGFCQVRTVDDPDLLRGESLDLVVFDEAAMMPRLEEIWIEVIRPALTDRRGHALFASTPKGRNYFYQLYMLGQDSEQPDWASWQLTSYDNPYIPTDEIDAQRASMPEQKFAQEFLAEFVDASSVFRNVTAAARATQQKEPQDGHSYTIGVDWGRTNDATCIVVYDSTVNAMAHMDRLVSVPFEQQIQRLQATIELWKPTTTIVEQNSIGNPLFERLQRLGLPTNLMGFTMTNASKCQLVDELTLAFENNSISILDDPILLAELQSYEATQTATGLTRYSHPTGGHDDTVDALLLAYGAAGSSKLFKPRWGMA